MLEIAEFCFLRLQEDFHFFHNIVSGQVSFIIFVDYKNSHS